MDISNHLTLQIMFSKTNLISTFVTAIWAFAGGYLLWGIIAEPLLADHMMSGLMKEVPDFLFLAVGCLIMAFAFSTIYSKGCSLFCNWSIQLFTHLH